MTTVEQQKEQIWVAPEAPVVTPVTTREKLHRAADILEEHAWAGYLCGAAGDPIAVGDSYPLMPRVGLCILGAVAYARLDYGDKPERSPSYAWAGAPLAHVFRDYRDAWRFNDAQGRTKAEVVARLREAAEASHE